MLRTHTWLIWLLAAAVVGVLPAAAIPSVQYSQDGIHFQPITFLQTAMTGAQYYQLGKHAGDPAFGIAKGEQSVALIWDTTDSNLSMLFISGGSTTGERGRGRLLMAGLPNSAALTISDDHGEFSTSHKRHKLSGTYGYRDSTDGFVLSNMSGTAYTAKLALNSGKGVTGLRLVDGDPHAGGDFVTLSLTKPLYLKFDVGTTPTGGGGSGGGTGGGGGGVGSSVPEPASLGLLGLAGMLFIKRPRRA